MAKSLDDYKSEKKSLENQISSRKSKNARISREIARLEDAYNKMGKIKRNNDNNADKVRDNTKLNKVAGNVEWRGKYKDQFDNAMKDRATPAAKDFFDSIDAMQDEIGRALDKKRGEYNTGSSILNGLNKAWNNVSGIIRNWVN
ncbi:MAG: DUF5082 domain-containing protein [Lachnospiraceae bacterium]|nr:DUF5082 domain-containing protein [Lachnospiraceae bacterium]